MVGELSIIGALVTVVYEVSGIFWALFFLGLCAYSYNKKYEITEKISYFMNFVGSYF